MVIEFKNDFKYRIEDVRNYDHIITQHIQKVFEVNYKRNIFWKYFEWFFKKCFKNHEFKHFMQMEDFNLYMEGKLFYSTGEAVTNIIRGKFDSVPDSDYYLRAIINDYFRQRLDDYYDN